MRIAVVIALSLCACAPGPPTYCGPKGTFFGVGFGPMSDLMRPPEPVAVGGQYVAYPHCSTDGHATPTIDHAFEIDDHGGPAVNVTLANGYGIRLSGEQEGENLLRLHNGRFDVTYPVTARVVDHVELELSAGDHDGVSPIAWALGRHRVRLVVTSGGSAVRDDDATATGPGLEMSPDGYVVDVGAPGELAFAVHAGTVDTVLTVPTTSSVDTIGVINDPTLEPGSRTRVCFGAFDQGNQVLGLTWTFALDPRDVSGHCAYVSAESGQATVEVTASAGGLSVTLALPVTGS